MNLNNYFNNPLADDSAGNAYRRAIMSGSTPELEKIISKSAEYSYLYAKNVIKGRFELGENAIGQDMVYSYHYAKNVIKGKLPEQMHNQMIVHGVMNPNYFATSYFDLIK